MEGAQDQMAGERRLNGDFRGFEIPNFPTMMISGLGEEGRRELANLSRFLMICTD